MPRADAIVEEQIVNFRRWHAWGNQKPSRRENRASRAVNPVTPRHERFTGKPAGTLTSFLQVSFRGDN